MQKWSRLQVGLLVVAVVLFAGVGVLAFMALEPDRVDCVEGARDVDAPIDRPADEALAEFVAANQGDYPLDGWEVASTDGDVTVFTNDDGGEHRVEVEAGVVRTFERCD